MTQDEIIEMAIQGHAGTRDAIRWAIKQARATQRTWVGLTHDEFKQIMLATYNIDLNVPGHSSDDYLLWNAIEAKLKEKNTP